MKTIADPAFWEALDRLVEAATIIVDRPKGSAHPRFPDLIYPIAYGYLDGTRAADGGGVDIWVGSMPDPRVVAVACTVDLVKRDTELKIVFGCTADEITTIERFHNGSALMKAAVILR